MLSLGDNGQSQLFSFSYSLFLETYEMLNDCDPDVAGWTDDGEMFVVKDQHALSQNYIPQFFGHSNFSSFDRQLNFYGFRKSYPDSLRKNLGNGASASVAKDSVKHVYFYHEHFKRGHPELFHLIKRASSKKPPKKAKVKDSSPPKNSEEVEVLKSEVAILERNLASVSTALQSKFLDLSSEVENQLARMKSAIYEATANIQSGPSQYSANDETISYRRAFHHISEMGPPPRPVISKSEMVESVSISQDDPNSLSMGEPPASLRQRPAQRLQRITTEEIMKEIGPALLKPMNGGMSRMTTMDQLLSMEDMTTSTLPSSLLRSRPAAGFSRKTTDEILNCLNGPNDDYDDVDGGNNVDMAPPRMHSNFHNDRAREMSTQASLKTDEDGMARITSDSLEIIPPEPNGTRLQRFSTTEVQDSLPESLRPLPRGMGRMTTEDFLGDWIDNARTTSIGTLPRSSSKDTEDDHRGFDDHQPHDATALLMLANPNLDFSLRSR